MATTQLNPSEISELIRNRIEKVGLAYLELGVFP